MTLSASPITISSTGRNYSLSFTLDTVPGCHLMSSDHQTAQRDGGTVGLILILATALSLSLNLPRQFQALRNPAVVLFYASFVHSARTGHQHSLSSVSTHFESFSR